MDFVACGQILNSDKTQYTQHDPLLWMIFFCIYNTYTVSLLHSVVFWFMTAPLLLLVSGEMNNVTLIACNKRAVIVGHFSKSHAYSKGTTLCHIWHTH